MVDTFTIDVIAFRMTPHHKVSWSAGHFFRGISVMEVHPKYAYCNLSADAMPYKKTAFYPIIFWLKY